MEKLNMMLVARGVRRGWLAHGTDAARLATDIRRYRLSLSAYDIVIREAPRVPGGKLVVVLASGEAAPSRLQNHASLAALLGLPCGSRQAWLDPAMCVYVSVWVVPVAKCRETPGKDTYVTSFWCKDRASAMAWVRDFKRKAARGFEADVLAPAGARFVYRMSAPV